MKGFLFTIDATLSLVILIGFAVIIAGNSWEMNLDEEMKLQMVQDAAEVCVLKNNVNNACVKQLVKNANSKINFDETCKDGTRIKREHIGYEGINIKVC